MTMGAPAATPVVPEPICNDCGIMADCKSCWKRMEPPAKPPSLPPEEVAVLRREWDRRAF